MSVRVTQLAYVQYRHPSLEDAGRFLNDFGFVECARSDDALYFRGALENPYCYVAHAGEAAFVCAGFEVADLTILEEAASSIPGASAVRPLPGPGGGSFVELRDPDGFRIDLVAGRAPAATLPATIPPVLNYGTSKQRFGEVQRFDQRPARVLRLGHFGFNVSSYERTLAWYRDTLGLIPSDILHAGEGGSDIAAFMRIARGDDWVDHHSFFFLESPTVHVHHASFEVQDFDEVMLASDWLKAAGWQQFWGVGRHILGSQIFDYWRDSSGFMIEHYADGDIFTQSRPSERHDVAAEMLSVWGPAPPKDFLD